MPFRPLAKKLVYYCKKKDVTKLFKCLKKVIPIAQKRLKSKLKNREEQ